ncbi:hypothetical protein K435DRAFT_703285 [Dendrothele bispora CBS 962.96]|uniref:Uncharacterized protein n=1 Tax=Dendrothele bispora (strain CBS 962.96) TaxID=1314807 RepID=A0A4S8KN52_DENBC|nr:hypothetical protein K435DRAFT_703285 [Dendrothele bispora CBS 962.96]
MDNLPRLRLSSAHFQLVLWLLKECGVTHVPSYSAFRKMQENLNKICGDEPKHFKSLFNNHFYVNDPSAAIKRNFANPHVASHMNFYPEVTSGPVSEVWQCERWKLSHFTDAFRLTYMFGPCSSLLEVDNLQLSQVAVM